MKQNFFEMTIFPPENQDWFTGPVEPVSPFTGHQSIKKHSLSTVMCDNIWADSKYSSGSFSSLTRSSGSKINRS